MTGPTVVTPLLKRLKVEHDVSTMLEAEGVLIDPVGAIIAFVALEEGATVSDDEVRAFCREHVGRHQIPRKVHFVDALPRNASGKILKRELREQFSYDAPE